MGKPNDTEVKDTRDVIIDHLDQIERNLTWLSEHTEIPYQTLRSVFVLKSFKIGKVRMAKINIHLKTNYKEEYPEQ